MTREEAIQFLDNMKHEEAGRAIGKDGFYAELMGYHVQALNIAIKALEQEPCEDAISREAVLDLAYTIPDEYFGTREVVSAEKIKELPPVTPQPKTGHWKRISIDKYSEHAKYWYRCDRCGKDNLGNTDWCPNCGCRMVEPQEVRIRNDS